MNNLKVIYLTNVSQISECINYFCFSDEMSWQRGTPIFQLFCNKFHYLRFCLLIFTNIYYQIYYS